jgi:hypothetical protein
VKQRDKQVIEQMAEIKYQKVKVWNMKQKQRRDRKFLTLIHKLMFHHGLSDFWYFAQKSFNHDWTKSKRPTTQLNTSRLSVSGVSMPLSRMSMASYPIYGSDNGRNLSASAYSRHSKISNSQMSNTRSVSPLNGQSS